MLRRFARSFLSLFAVAVPALLGDRPSRAADPAKPVATTVEAVVETSLATRPGQIRQFAFDGDDRTYFASEHDAGPEDHVTLVFDTPVAVTTVEVKTGSPEGLGVLAEGTLEVSADATTFTPLANFAEGAARGDAGGRSIRAIRIRPGKDRPQLLAVRELKFESVPAVVRFAAPVEFVVDVSDAPEMKAWAEKVARICERAYPMIDRELASEGYRPPHLVRLALRSQYRGVAAASNDRIVGSVRYFKEHPDDVGAMVHETVHIVQRYQKGNPPSWLVEGISDYIRFFKYEPGMLGRINPRQARFDRSYRVSAAFLAYLTEHYDPTIVRTLNGMLREGRYTEAAFKDLTGKSVQELDEQWRASLADGERGGTRRP